MLKNLQPFHLPKSIHFGCGAIGKIPEEVNFFGSKRVLLITDRHLLDTGYPDKIIDMLKGINVFASCYSDVQPEPTVQSVQDMFSVIKNEKVDCLIGLGGGSVLDVAKALSILFTNDGIISDYFGVNKIKVPGLPFILIPTTSGTGAEVTANAVFIDENSLVKNAVVSNLIIPNIAIIDPEITISCPGSITASTGMDALAHAIESYTAKRATPLTDMYSLEAIKHISMYLRKAVYNGSNIEARYYTALGSLYGGVGLANAGVNGVHCLAHALGAKHNVPHGVANGLLLPYVMEYNLFADFNKFANIACTMGENIQGLSQREAALRSVTAVNQLRDDVGIPGSLSDLDITLNEDTAKELVLASMASTRPMSNNPRLLTEKDVYQIFKNAS